MKKRTKTMIQEAIQSILDTEPGLIESLVDEVNRNPFDIGPEDEFRWVTKDGRQLLPADMRTMHLFYALRMLFNHSVPAAFRVGKFRRYKDVRDIPREYFIRAIDELSSELETRDDLDIRVTDSSVDSILDQLLDINENAAVLGALEYGPILNDGEFASPAGFKLIARS